MRYLASIIAVVFFTTGHVARAQTAAGEQPAAPSPADQRAVEPAPDNGLGTLDVREYEEGTQAITEYRRFGQLYMLKVKPKGAAPLYMIDQYGDGELNRRPADSIEDDVNLPKWRLGSF